MLTEIWTDQGIEDDKIIQSKLIYVGDLPFIPTEGMLITLYEGHAPETVLFSHYDVPSGTLYVRIDLVDSDDTYDEIEVETIGLH